MFFKASDGGILERFIAPYPKVRRAYTLDGYRYTRSFLPIDCAGRFGLNFARTAPLLPWARVTRPHITRTRDFSFGFWAERTWLTCVRVCVCDGVCKR